MARIPRMIVTGEPTVYHVISRTALDGFVLEDVEKEFLLNLIKRLSSVYFAEVLGFCIMGTHFHLLVRMHPGGEVADAEIRRRFSLYYGSDEKQKLGDGRIHVFREKWGSLSEYVREIKQVFSRYYNKLHGRTGFFWGERFKSVIVDNGDTLINCLAYIDLNPVRAGICEVPEDYRWSSLGYHVQSGNKDGFLSLDFGLKAFGVKNAIQRLHYYREFVYEKGSISAGKGAAARSAGVEQKKREGFAGSARDRFRSRTRYFTDSGIIGSKDFVARHYLKFKGHFSSHHEKRPRAVAGLEGVYSLKRLSE
jgi:putative transposase